MRHRILILKLLYQKLLGQKLTLILILIRTLAWILGLTLGLLLLL